MDLCLIVEPLLNWYAANRRELPWRDEPTPYRVWISEIMLQQTRVEAVLPYFERFVRELPDVRALAEAPEDRLLKLWEGLGYYSRARNLQKAARLVLSEYGGALPRRPEELKKLPGIGDYTAGAIASIAFGRPEPAVDGNVLRVLARLTADVRDVRDPAAKKRAAAALRAVYPEDRGGDFTQALMELGATVCLPNGAPLCGACPLSGPCEGLKTGRAASLPVSAPKPARKTEEKTVFLLLCGGRAALQKRPESGLLAGMWEFPNAPGALSPEEARRTLAGMGLRPRGLESLPAAKHVFTHLEWRMRGYAARVPVRSDRFVWTDRRELRGEYAVPAAYKTFLRILLSREELC
mgnify:CR=1 FL=1